MVTIIEIAYHVRRHLLFIHVIHRKRDQDWTSSFRDMRNTHKFHDQCIPLKVVTP